MQASVTRAALPLGVVVELEIEERAVARRSGVDREKAARLVELEVMEKSFFALLEGREGERRAGDSAEAVGHLDARLVGLISDESVVDDLSRRLRAADVEVGRDVIAIEEELDVPGGDRRAGFLRDRVEGEAVAGVVLDHSRLGGDVADIRAQRRLVEVEVADLFGRELSVVDANVVDDRVVVSLRAADRADLAGAGRPARAEDRVVSFCATTIGEEESLGIFLTVDEVLLLATDATARDGDVVPGARLERRRADV